MLLPHLNPALLSFGDRHHDHDSGDGGDGGDDGDDGGRGLELQQYDFQGRW